MKEGIGSSELRSRMQAVLNPLIAAAKVDRVANLGPAVLRGCTRVLELGVPEDLAIALGKVRLAFEAADAPPDESTASEAGKLEPEDPVAGRVAQALELLSGYREAGWEAALLARPLTVMTGVGPRRAEALAKRGLSSVEQLLFHLPSSYDDRRSLVTVADLEVGRRATFIAEVQSTGHGMSRGRGGRLHRVVEAVVGDETGSISLKWFHGGDEILGQLPKGGRILVTGDVRRHRFKKQIVHPETERLEDSEGDSERPGDLERLHALRRVVPYYSTPEGIPARTLRTLIERAVAEYAGLVVGYLPERLVREQGLPEADVALRVVHSPAYEVDLDEYDGFGSAAHRRLVLEELYLLELGLALRHAEGARLPGVALRVETDRVCAAPEGLPFELTGAQRRAWEEIRADLSRPHPMNRLLQGDVGCGKTVVAFLAAVAAAASGHQAALMAPTELLAEQHLRTLERLVAESGPASKIRVGLLTASLGKPEADATRRALAEGELDLVVGTHALLGKDVAFAKLALIIVDEQHRFGVLQRQALAAKLPGDLHPHALVMTATPIPRTLALTLYGDLDTSVIDERPPGRGEVETLLLRSGEGEAVSRLVEETVARGEQVYVVYPLVEESEKIDLRSAIQSSQRIERAFPSCRVDLVHGRQTADERREAMRRFASGETQILVATTVIEVGVDVAEATLMVIEHAERFGLAQLHQLRGRVGRGRRPGTCVLVSRASSLPKRGEQKRGESQHEGGREEGEAADRGEERLKAMLATTDGFEIANSDLRIRGPGDFLGTRQSGHLPDLRVADLLRDQRLIALARNAAFEQVRSDPKLARSPELALAVKARWGERLALVGVA